MIVLGIETATELVGVALADPDGPRAAVWATGRRRHAESLAPAIAHVLDQAGLTLRQVDAIAVDLGPGLFTGLRVGVATAKGLAQGLGVGLLGLTSTEVLAAAAYRAGHRGRVVAVVDGRRGEVFAARYASGGGRAGFAEVSPPSRHTPEALAADLSAATRPGDPEGGWLAVGDGAHRYADHLVPVAGLRIAAPAGPPPEALAALAAERLAGGTATQPPEAVQPVYLREADAQINWVQRAPATGRSRTGR